MTTFSEIEAAAAKLGSRSEIGRAVDCIVDEARQNAVQTVFVEKAAPRDSFDAIALASLETVLSGGNFSRAVAKWFAAAGVRW